MKNFMKTWLMATVSASVGIALGMLLAPSKKNKNCSVPRNNEPGNKNKQ